MTGPDWIAATDAAIARLASAIARANRGRAPGSPDATGPGSGDATGASARRAEAAIETHFRASEKLVVYGTLLPGERNHHVVQSVGGEWSTCAVSGALHPAGWGAVVGYPAIRLDPGGEMLPVMLLTAPALPDHWARLDRFEGDEYRRVLVMVHTDRGRLTVANIYEAREIP
jgi:gamma-glutamylcyclotransferase (GGCT)/AIG2-like uncharacterized protein YtfP